MGANNDNLASRFSFEISSANLCLFFSQKRYAVAPRLVSSVIRGEPTSPPVVRGEGAAPATICVESPAPTAAGGSVAAEHAAKHQPAEQTGSACEKEFRRQNLLFLSADNLTRSRFFTRTDSTTAVARTEVPRAFFGLRWANRSAAAGRTHRLPRGWTRRIPRFCFGKSGFGGFGNFDSAGTRTPGRRMGC
jgi:hypothetical protein